MGMYLPATLSVTIPIGALLGYFYNRWAVKQDGAEAKKRLGTLAATGLIVGESLFGVVNAAIIAAYGGDSPLEIFAGGPAANWVGAILFVVVLAFVYRYTAKKSEEA